MKNPFSKKLKRQLEESAPQLTLWESGALRQPGSSLGMLDTSLYDEMLKDSMVQTVITLKKLAVLSGKYSIVSSDNSPQAHAKAQFVIDNFEQMEGSVFELLFHAMDSFVKGWSIQEIVYKVKDGQIWLEAVRPKDPSLFGLKVNSFGKIEGLILFLPGQSEQAIPRSKFAIHFNRPSYSKPKGVSDLDAAHRHWVSKQSLLSAWKVHLEKFAMPTVLGRYERGLPPNEQTSILRALQDIQNNTAVVYPREIDVSLLGGDRGPSTGFQEAIEFHNREIARSVLGQTLTTDEGRRVGSLALGKVHLQILLLQVNSLRKQLADSLVNEQIIRPLVELNFGPGQMPRLEFDDSGVSAFASGELK